MGKLQVKKGDRACSSVACDLCVDEDRLDAWMAVAKVKRSAMFPRPVVGPIDRAAVALAKQEAVFAE